MITLEEFLKRFPAHDVHADEIELFLTTVLSKSDAYDNYVQQMRASGRYKSLSPKNMNTTNLLSARERAEYPRDLYRTLLALADGRKATTGLTSAISDILKKDNPSLAYAGDETHQTLLIPLSELKAQNVTSAPAGGHLVATDVSHQVEYALRAASVCLRAGARVIPNLRGDLTIGREVTEGGVFEWLHELEECQEADASYGAVRLTPHRLCGMTSLSTQLNQQSAPDLSSFVVESLSRGIGAAWDRAGIQGSGVGGEPLGLFNRSGTQTVTFGAAANWLKAVSFEAKISGANGDDDGIAWVANPDVREKWRTLQRFSGSSTALWEGNLCADRPAFVTTNCPTTKILAGDFSKMVFATFGEGSPVSVLVDKYSAKKSGKLEVLVSLLGDVGILNESCFAISTDSAIQ